jgi:para-nitrobenzyl esterase
MGKYLRGGLAGLVVAFLTMMSATAIERSVTGGIVSGEVLPDGTTIFRSIPFAEPPVGDRRWRPPVPLRTWTGVRDVTKAAPPCVQRSYEWNAADAFNGREDCLYIAVQSPPHAASERLPVMVWIHGGANRAGSGRDVVASPITRRGVVLVTIQYRLGIFGFASMTALTAESPQHASGNYGLMDQIAALKWVRDNIANFGGDPDNVTIFGQSAGAQDVGLLMLSPRARGLFHKAIEESGTAGFGVPPRTLVENERMGDELGRLLGVVPGQDGLRALRAAPTDVLLDATDKLMPPNTVDPSFIWLQAVVDGWVLPISPAEILQRGEQAGVPLIIGSAEREFSVVGAREYPRRWIEENAGERAREAVTYYGLDANAGNSLLAERLSTDVIFRCPAIWVADQQRRLTREVWRYEFGLPAPDTVYGVEHSSELKYVFQRTPAGASLADWPPLQAYWTNFARSGDPNGGGLPRWPELEADHSYINFTAQGPAVAKQVPNTACSFFRKP